MSGSLPRIAQLRLNGVEFVLGPGKVGADPQDLLEVLLGPLQIAFRQIGDRPGVIDLGRGIVDFQ